ncbi:S8 family serine peptidase [Ureaplasma parvum]|uniref:S8 family serine peptidase n=1 Tax=Ureaplasma parvum TaxID=134821 RepID=UPI001E2AC33D
MNIGFYNFINGKEINDDKDFKRELKKYIDTLNKDDIVNNTINKYKFKNYIYDFISYYFDIINIFSAGNSYNDEIRYRNKNGHILEINWFDISKYSFMDRFNQNSIYVGSTNKNNEKVSNFSDRHHLNDVKNKYGDLLMPFLVASGEGIYDTSIITKFIKNKGDKNINLGTSFSAPIVTGAISLLQSYYMVNNANKTIPLTHIRSILAASSIPLKNNENYDFYKNSFSHLYGAGNLDFKRAIEAYKNAKQTKILTKHKDKQLVKEMDISIDNDQTNFNFALSWLFKPTSNSFSKKMIIIVYTTNIKN